MSLSSTTTKAQYNGNGSTTAFSTVCPFNANSHLVVVETVVATGVNTIKAIGPGASQYLVTGAATGSAGTVTMGTAPASGVRLTIRRVVPLTQTVDYIANDPFPAETHESALDLLTMGLQQIQEQVNRCIQFPSTETTSADGVLGLASARANKSIGFDSTGNAIAMNELGQWRGDWATATSYIYGDIIREHAVTDNLYICIVAHTSGTFATDLAALDWTLIADLSSITTNVAAAAASASAAATSASAAATSATAAASSATSAASSATSASSSATTATTQATNASTSATNAATSATSSATSATASAASATAAAASVASINIRTINSQSAGYTVIASDQNKLIKYTGSGHTLALTAAATLGATFECVVMNAGTGVLTIDPNSSETIDGSSTLALLPGQIAVINCDGSNWLVGDFMDVKGVKVNAQTGTTYTVLQTDRQKLVTCSNAAAVAVTLPQATGNFGVSFAFWIENKGAGTVTITPTTSTIDGSSSLALTQNQGCFVVSDGTNYSTMRGIGGSSSGLTSPNASGGTIKTVNIELGTSLTTILSAPGSGKTWRITSLKIINNDTTARTFDLQLNDGTTTGLLEDDYTLGPKSMVEYRNICIHATSGFIKGLTSSATTIYAQCSYVEEANTESDGAVISLNTADTDIIAAVASSKARKVLGLYLHNTQTSAKTVTLKHKDATAGTEINVVNAYTLGPLSTIYLEDLHCATGGYIKGASGTTNGDILAVLAYREEAA